jgi:hypothetical protein
MLKPELSWFSSHRVLGGAEATATSYAAPLVSRLAAHTWSKLRDPSPSLVKALMICAADGRRQMNARTGFGSPTNPRRPWMTPEHSVTLCWRGFLTEKGDYSWSKIDVPLGLRSGMHFRGSARLVAILEPITHMRGSNYFSTRLEARLQYYSVAGKWDTLIGGYPPDTEEYRARVEDHKWDPIRFYDKASVDVELGRPELRVTARVYWRDRFLYPSIRTASHEVPVSFVLHLRSHDPSAPVHDQIVSSMEEHVESEVLEAEIEQPAR